MRKLFVISRVRDPDTRKQLEMDDGWKQRLVFHDERKAVQEVDWLNGHNRMREYLLVAVTPPDNLDGLHKTDLDDEIPFNLRS